MKIENEVILEFSIFRSGGGGGGGGKGGSKNCQISILLLSV